MENYNGFDLDLKRTNATESNNRETASHATTITFTIGMTTSDNCSAPTCTCFC